jgi:hypothetical protein
MSDGDDELLTRTRGECKDLLYASGIECGMSIGRKLERAAVLDEIDACILEYQDKGLLGALLVKVAIMRRQVDDDDESAARALRAAARAEWPIRVTDLAGKGDPTE